MAHQLLYSLPTFISEHTDLFITIFIGAVAGYLAEFIVPGRGYGFLVTVIFGIVGGWLGQMFFTFIHFNTDIPYLNELLRATLGAMILVIIFNLITRTREKKDGRKEKDVYEWSNE